MRRSHACDALPILFSLFWSSILTLTHLPHKHPTKFFILPRSIAVSLTGAKQTRKGRGGTRTARDRPSDRPSEEEDNE